MQQARPAVFGSGDWQVDLARRELRARGMLVPLGSRAFELLEVLVLAAGALVTKSELMDRVWPGAIVEESTLHVHMSAVRRAFGRDRALLRTEPGRGYRLLGNWTTVRDSVSMEPAVLVPAPIPARPTRTNLPIVGSDLIGRKAPARHLRVLMSAYRVVTLTGPGGIGKTALGLEVARDQRANFQGEAWLVELAALSDPGLVPSAVADALDLKLGGEKSPEALARAIGGKKLLLVLDNCEHVINGAALLAQALMRLCPGTAILATSREALRIDGECVYQVPPLDVPPPAEDEAGDVLEHSAVQLFIARTSALNHDATPTGGDLQAIAAICRRLDGIPLAIEFAAARVGTFGIREVAARLDDRFGFLTAGRRTALPRHQTLRATLDWSYDLLPESEQHLLRHLAVFRGGFTLDAATAVAGIGGAADVLEGIANLVAKSLVALDRSAPGVRWGLLETIRTHALEKLGETGEAARAARRQAEFFRDLLAPALPGSPSPPAIAEMTRYGREIDNVRAALDWAFGANAGAFAANAGAFSTSEDSRIGVVLTAAYTTVWMHLALMAECRERTERALDALGADDAPTAPLRMQLHIALGFSLVFTMGDVDRIKLVLARALEVAQSLDDVDAQLCAIWTLWALHFNIADCRAAQAQAERFSSLALRSGDPSVTAVAERLLSNTLHHAGRQREAERCCARVLDGTVPPPTQRHAILFQYDQRTLTRATLARVLWLQGLLDRAVEHAQACLAEAAAADHKFSNCAVLYYAVWPVMFLTDDLAPADRAVAKLCDLATRLNAALWQMVGSGLEGKMLTRRGEFAKGSALLRAMLDKCERTGWTIGYPESLGVLAEGLAGLGQLTEARAVVDRALSRADRSGERWYVAELLRTRGEFLLQAPGDRSIAAAEDSFREALDVAREQGALFWELRTTLSLARLRVRQDRQDEARQALAPVYGRFTEGFATPDLRAARTMLESLTP